MSLLHQDRNKKELRIGWKNGKKKEDRKRGEKKCMEVKGSIGYGTKV